MEKQETINMTEGKKEETQPPEVEENGISENEHAVELIEEVVDNLDEAGEEIEEEERKSKKRHMVVSADAPWVDRMWEVFTTFWPLGLIAFGGPQAHVAILRDHLVEQRDWLDEEEFTELFAIGQVSFLLLILFLYLLPY